MERSRVKERKSRIKNWCAPRATVWYKIMLADGVWPGRADGANPTIEPKSQCHHAPINHRHPHCRCPCSPCNMDLDTHYYTPTPAPTNIQTMCWRRREEPRMPPAHGVHLRLSSSIIHASWGQSYQPLRLCVGVNG